MRVKFTVTVDYETAENLRQLSKVTRINISRLMDEAVEDLTDKYNLDELVEKYEEKERLKKERLKKEKQNKKDCD